MAVVVYTDATKTTVATESQINVALSEGASLCIYSGYGDNKKEYIFWDRRRYQTMQEMIESNWYNNIETARTIICDLLYEAFREREDQALYIDHSDEYDRYGGYRNFYDLYHQNGISDHDREWQKFVLDHAKVEYFDHIDQWLKEQKCYRSNSDRGLFYQFKFDHEIELIKRGARLLKRLIAKRVK